MIIALVSQFQVYLPWVNAHLAYRLNSVLNVKVLEGDFNQALVGAFSMIVQLRRLIVCSTSPVCKNILAGRERGNDGTDPRLRHFITADNKTAAGSGRHQLYPQPQPRNITILLLIILANLTS